MTQLTIQIPGTLPVILAETLEDSLAVLLEYMGFVGKIDSADTGNVTMFPNHNINRNLYLLQLVREQLEVGGYVPIVCPTCGSDEIFTCDDDDEMRECNNCGHVWEIDDDSEDG